MYAEDDLVAAVTGRWGDEVAPGGVVDRGAVAKKAFASDEERKWLESQIWPRVGEKVAEFLDSHTGLDDPPRALVIEVPLLFESGLDRGYDATIAVIADEEVRAQRAGARGHESVDERTKAQLTQEEKAERATYVVHNDGSIADLERALSGVLDKLTAAQS
ncbi:MAG: dephospho-CoA kinase [Solirubrobacteraceae bacterium]|nr:dephospho-CoA kinase [Solirubrobacteraceae bacterium]